MIDGDDCGAISGTNKCQGKPKSSEETCPSAALSTIDPTLLDLDSIRDRSDEKPVTNHLSYKSLRHMLL
jgi:hypothetical protein